MRFFRDRKSRCFRIFILEKFEIVKSRYQGIFEIEIDFLGYAGIFENFSSYVEKEFFFSFFLFFIHLFRNFEISWEMPEIFKISELYMTVFSLTSAK